MQAIILAAGLGTRLGSLGARLPKCLLPIAGQPLLARQLAALEQSSRVADYRVVIGSQGEAWNEASTANVMAIAGRERVIVNPKNRDLDNGYSLERALDVVGGPVLLLDGDVLFHPELLSDLLADGAPENWLVARAGGPQDKGGRITVDAASGRVRHLSEYLAATFSPWFIYAGMGRLSAPVIAALKEEQPAHPKAFEAIGALVGRFPFFVHEPQFKPAWINLNLASDLEAANRLHWL